MAVRVVDLASRPVHAFPRVDAILGLTKGTARRWIDGHVVKDREYPPVIREERTESPVATWGEFVEARLLAEFRDEGVPIQRLRSTVQRLRQELQTPYPLATARPWLRVEGREVVARVQEGTAPALQFVVRGSGQLGYALSSPARSFVEAVTWSEEQPDTVATEFRPVTDIYDVVCNPLRQVGAPTVEGIPVESLTELFRTGEPVEAIAEMHGLTPNQVHQAVRYELVRRATAA